MEMRNARGRNVFDLHANTILLVIPSLIVSNDSTLNITPRRARTGLVTIRLAGSIDIVGFLAEVLGRAAEPGLVN